MHPLIPQAYIMTMASGGQPPVFKYYFYGQVCPAVAIHLAPAILSVCVELFVPPYDFARSGLPTPF